MKKVLCDKDGKFLSVHDGDCILAELEDGNCLTHKDGTIVIYKESEEDPLLENMYFHAYYKNGSLHLPKKTSSFYDYVSCGYKFSTKEEKKRMNEVLSENNLYYDEKENVLKSFIGVPKWVIPITISIGTALQYARLWKQTANRTISDTKTLTIFKRRKRLKINWLQLKAFSMIRKECYI